MEGVGGTELITSSLVGNATWLCDVLELGWNPGSSAT